VEDVAKTLQLDKLLDRKPKQLSGGQRQRVAIGRAMVREPKIFLFDEPLSNLDAALRVQMRIELARLHDRLNATMIYVTHDQVEAMTLADKIVVLRDGKLEQVGSPLELYHHPVNRFVAGFIGSPTMNFIEVKASAVDSDGVTVQLANGRSVKVPVAVDGVSAGAPLVLGVRPEHLHPADDGLLEGEIMVVERLGGETYLYVQNDAASGLIVAEAGGNSTARVHEAARLGFDAADAQLFTPDGLALQRRDRHPMILSEKKTHL
jgi:multiple sugar transport system ATP-binding protein